ncbi:RnfH family protein [Dyella sp. RRB7]|uniref:RnfH family protein n=1 Tax=Dyella sp. RRB7 TaxID=2919502 RepID=UPI001FAB29A2|nr:RnfH family protein [Dyella sp. RRB7]
MADRITVEVVYAGPDRQFTYRLSLPAGSTVMQAIEASGLQQDMPGLLIDPSRLGIFSRKVAPDHGLDEGDRVEIYRPLTLDPKEARRRRAHEG